MTKDELRKQIKTRINEMGKETIQAESEKLCKKIIEAKVYQSCTTLLAYMPLSDEVNVLPLIEDALSKGKKVYLPRIFPGTNDMEFYRYTKESQTEKGQFGIKEPAPDKANSFTKLIEKMSIQQYSPAAHSSVYVDIDEQDPSFEHILILVPGRAFTKDGRRLGRGKGFYDNYLSKIPQIFDIKKSGVCFENQLFDQIPTTPDDILMDIIFSPSI